MTSLAQRLVILLASFAALACAATPPAVSDARVRELQSLRWGMFVCWSFSTFSGKEWTPGITDVAYFKPTGCDTYGNLFSLDVGPDYAGCLREIDVQTLRRVGQMIRARAAAPVEKRSR